MQIKNKIALITGAASGIGQAITQGLIDKQAAVVAIADSSTAINDIAEQLSHNATNTVVIPFVGDVTSSAFRQQVFQQLEKDHGVVRICVPAAGILRDGLAVKQDNQKGEVTLYDEQQFTDVMRVNLQHPTYWAMQTIVGVAKHRFEIAQNAKERIEKWQAKEGIQAVNILIGSVSSRGNRGQVAYAAAKSALIAVTKTLNLEGLAHGVQTKIIHPGFVDTPMLDNMNNDYFEKHTKPLIGLQRKIQPEEISDIICSMIENPVISGEVWADASLMLPT